MARYASFVAVDCAAAAECRSRGGELWQPSAHAGSKLNPGLQTNRSATAKVLDLVPHSVYVVGSYGCQAPPPPPPAPHACPAVGYTGGGAFTLGGAAAAVEEVAVPAGSLSLAGLVILRWAPRGVQRLRLLPLTNNQLTSLLPNCTYALPPTPPLLQLLQLDRCDLRVHCDLLLRVAAPPGGPTPQALAHAVVEASQQLAGPQLVFVSEPR